MSEVYVQKGDGGVLQLYSNKVRRSLGHTPTGFSLSGFQRAQPPFILNSLPHVVLFLFPGTRKAQLA